MRIHTFLLSAIILLLGTAGASSQIQTRKILDKVNTPPSVSEGTALSVGVDLFTNSGVRRILLWYRPFGVSEFKEVEMLLAGRSATATIPGSDVRPPFVEYFVLVQMENDSTESLPELNPRGTPLNIEVRQVDPKDQEIRIMSPEPGETVAWEDLVVAVSLYYASPAIQFSFTKIFFDDVDVSKNVVVAEDVILYAPRNFSDTPLLGPHRLRVEVRDTSGNLYHTVSQSFSVSTAEALAAEKARLTFFGDGSVELRNEQLSGVGSFYGRGDFRANGEWSGLKFGTQLRYDNQESPSRQPQNRYLLFGSYESYVNVQFGDAYPRFPVMAMSGKRVRGLNASLNSGYVNLDVAIGETDRLVEGVKDSVHSYGTDTSSADSRPNNTRRIGTTGLDYEFFTPGTFTREFYGFRPSFGSGDNFQLGISFLKFRDKLGSILRGTNPSENIVTGIDVMFAFDDQRTRFDAQAMLGLANNDISGGNFTDADYDSLKRQGQDVKDLGKIAESFITVNANLNPLNPIAAGLPGFAFDANASLNYFDNYLRANVTRRGSGYHSFGNEFLQTDLQGYTVSDNLRLLSNKLFLSVAYDYKSDNINNTKFATTSFGNLSTSITISPGIGFPTLQVGYGLLNHVGDGTIRPPGIADSNATYFRSSKSADDKTNRVTVGTSYDFTTGYRYNVSASLSSLSRKDASIYRRDQSSFLFSTNGVVYFKVPLEASVGILTSRTKGANQLFNAISITNDSTLQYWRARGTDSLLTESNVQFTTLTLGAKYRLMNDQLRLLGTISPTFGDVKRFALRAGGIYTYLERHVFELTFDYYNVSSSSNFIAAFTYRFNF